MSQQKHSGLLELPVALPRRSIRLELAASLFGDDHQALEKLRRNLSAVESDGKHLWLAGDEGFFIEQFIRVGNGGDYADHRRYSLAEPFGLSTDDGEIDLEGLSKDGSRLWLLGSHCLTRRSPEEAAEKKNAAAEALDRMKIKKRRKVINRCFLGCLDLDQAPARGGEFAQDSAAKVRFTAGGNDLLDIVARDDQLAPFLKLPAKENGLDFEGIAARGETVLIGLRGPVLGGLALILEFRLRVDHESRRVQLCTVDEGRPFAKHAFDLQGLGIRDLTYRGKDLLILAAPTMALDGTAAIFRWRPAKRALGGGLVDKSQYRPVLRLPGGNRGDYAEGISVAGRELFVAYDQLSDTRLDHGDAALLDGFEM
jgi:hypothetical protein